MKICIVSVQWEPIITGGGGVSVLNLVRELSKEHDVTVYAFGIGSLPEYEETSLRGKTIHVYRFFTSDSDKISSPFDGNKKEEIQRLKEFVAKVAKNIRCDKCGVIHLHGHFVVPSLAKILKNQGCRSKIVSTIHAFESIIELEKGSFSSEKEIFETIVSMERDALEYSDIVTVGSNVLLNKIREIHGEEYLKNVRIVHLGISDNLFEYENTKEEIENIRNKFAADSYLVFNLNRLDPSKGLEILIDSSKYLAEHLKDKKITLIIAGKYEERNREYLNMLLDRKKRIETKHKSIRIHILKNIEEKLKLLLFDASDVFVMPSPTEPFGLTILESLARGTPVIVPDVEGPREIFGIKEKIDREYLEIPGGLMVNYSEPSLRTKNLAFAIKEILMNLKKYKANAQNAKNNIKKRYSWNSVAQKFLDIYHDC